MKNKESNIINVKKTSKLKRKKKDVKNKGNGKFDDKIKGRKKKNIKKMWE